jgi:tRNA pseudouridine38-40 synthase
MKNVLLTIAYDGTGFCGWQKQPGQRSVQEEVERALSTVCAGPIRINGTSRTDAGVHAYGQRASFTADFRIPIERIPVAANGIFASFESEKSRKMSGEISILKAEEVSLDFHARFRAEGKKYIYKINNSQNPDPFRRNYCWQIARKLDLNTMREAAVRLIGTKDFKCFQAAGGKEQETTVRTVYSARVYSTESDNIIFEIIGDGFLYNMVRIITGTLIDVGLGKKTADDLTQIIDSGDRRLAGPTAPPQGLYLAEVYFENKALQKAAESLCE